MRNPFSMSRDDLLAGLGLQTRRSAAAYVVPAISMFAVGILAGAGLGLLFAPSSGNETRRQIGTKVNDVTSRVKTKLQELQQKAKNEMSHTVESARDSLYGNSDYSASTDYGTSGLGSDLGMDTGRRTGLTST